MGLNGPGAINNRTQGQGGMMSTSQKINKLGNVLKDRLGHGKITPLQRFEKLCDFEEADRLTGSLAFWSPSTVGIEEVSIREYYSDPEKMYYCQLLALDKLGYDYPLLFSDNYNTEPQALGAKIEFVGDDTPMIVRPAIKNKEELSDLDIPDPFTDGRLPYRLDICRLHSETLGAICPTITSINAPFSLAVGVRGYEQLMIDVFEDPDFVHDLLAFCTQVVLRFGSAIKTVCGKYPALSDAWSSIPNLSPKLFLEFSFPYATKCIQKFENCGWSFGGGHQFSQDWKSSLFRILDSGTRSFTLFEENISGFRGGIVVDIVELKRICRQQKVFLTTAVHPETLLKGPAGEIESKMSRWISHISAGGGQAFYASVLSGTPEENVKAYVNVIKKAFFASYESVINSNEKPSVDIE